MILGTVKHFVTGRGFGFIARDDNGRDVFVHYSELVRCGFPENPPIGLRLGFDIGQRRDGREHAVNLTDAQTAKASLK